MKPDNLKPAVPLLKGASYFPVPIDRIQPDRGQPRQVFPEEELANLAQSIRQRGMLHPLVVRHAAARNRYIIITGERRYRAAQKAELSVIPCLIIAGELTEIQILGLRLTENLLREDLKPVEEAEAYHTLMTLQGWNRLQLGQFLGICPSGITRRFSLLTLSGAIKAEVEAGNLAPDSAYFISQLPEPRLQEELARRTLQGGLPRNAVAAEVRRALGKPTGVKGASKEERASPNSTPTSGKKGNPVTAGASGSPTVRTGQTRPQVTSPGQQKLFNIDSKSTVLVQTSAAKLSAADVFANLQQAMLEASQSLNVPEQEDSSTMQIVQELLSSLSGEEQALGSELQDLMNLLALMITNKLGALLKNKLGVGAAAQRVLNRLGESTQRTVGSLLEYQSDNKTK